MHVSTNIPVPQNSATLLAGRAASCLQPRKNNICISVAHLTLLRLDAAFHALPFVACDFSTAMWSVGMVHTKVTSWNYYNQIHVCILTVSWAIILYGKHVSMGRPQKVCYEKKKKKIYSRGRAQMRNIELWQSLAVTFCHKIYKIYVLSYLVIIFTYKDYTV